MIAGIYKYRGYYMSYFTVELNSSPPRTLRALEPICSREAGLSSTPEWVVVGGGELGWVCLLSPSSVVSCWGLPQWMRGSHPCTFGLGQVSDCRFGPQAER
ncbi:hypothetical protein CHARACLAT_006640 [Characodon lateralis]|uniref:Uncharacterized protein n=1 Tax=Characodon lateralis TaxID=208331 RepID=A0ABU7D550_9TELE|nr:hypothetical protein [Characodon lateralis]